MHIVLLNYGYSPGFATSEELLERFHTLIGWSTSLAKAGARVTLFQRFDRDHAIERDGVVYRFVADRLGQELRAWQTPRRLLELVRATRPDLVHLNGLMYPVAARALRMVLPARCAIAAQHHAELPRKGARAALQRWGLRAIDGFLFAAHELAQPWVERGMIGASQPVYQIPEGSNWFQPAYRATARARSGMHGNPVFLWVGRLDSNKDPLTVLEGFERALAHAPGARLYLIYSDDPLLAPVRARIEATPALRQSVELLGRLPYRNLGDYYNSADYFVLGSHHEAMGYALAEALACGVVPIVTDIPSFRVMTDHGAIGRLWPPGNAEALAAAIGDLLGRPQAALAEAARHFFEQQLSYGAIARQALAAYGELTARRGQL